MAEVRFIDPIPEGGAIRVLMCYGSAMARIDDMKLFGGVSGGTTGSLILDAFSEYNKKHESLYQKHESLYQMLALTNPGMLAKKSGYRSFDPSIPSHVSTPQLNFRTWEEYRDLLYAQCKEFDPDIVICAVAVSNFTPEWIVETRKEVSSKAPGFHRLQVDGKVDTRDTETLTIQMGKTPNIINWVRNHLGGLDTSKVLVGFKLTSHGNVDALVAHAREVLDNAGCDFVVANDLKLGLERKLFVTPTGVVEGTAEGVPAFATQILEAKRSGYFSTRPRNDVEPAFRDIEKSSGVRELWDDVAEPLWHRLKPHMPKHGTFAVRIPDLGFITTTRGKKIVGSTGGWPVRNQVPLTMVWDIDKYEAGTIITGRQDYASEKATLNAPLLHRIFENAPEVLIIVHQHRYLKDAPTLPYVPPGTRAEAAYGDQFRTFNIEGHGSVVSFNGDIGNVMRWVNDDSRWTDIPP